ncbi:MAG TPA: hypothetical protein VIX73_03980 [Kofleriaceae bacterium]|jgi:hypothetical protein
MNDPSTRLERAIAQLGSEHEPPPGWQARVLAAIESSKPPQSSPLAWLRRWWAAIAAPVLAAAAVVLWFSLDRPRPLRLAVALESDPKLVVRGGSSSGTGDVVAVPLHSRVVLTAHGGKRHRALWVYRGERELVATCPGSTACEPGDEPRFVYRVETLEPFQVIVLSSEGTLPVPTGTYDSDAAAALAVHGEAQTRAFKVE